MLPKNYAWLNGLTFSAGELARIDRYARCGATAYLLFLFSTEGQDILVKNYYRVRDGGIAARYRAQFPEVRLISIERTFGGWDNVMRTYFGAAGGVLDQD